MTKGPYKFSPSTLNLLSECHRCFWLHFNAGIKRPATIFPSLPSGMDKILKEYYDKHIEKSLTPAQLQETQCTLFKDLALLPVWQNNFKGIRTIDSHNNTISGAVDSILEKENPNGTKTLIVLDFKTRGYPPKETTSEYYHDQLAIYTWLLKQNGFNTTNYAYLLYYYPKKVENETRISFHTKLVKVNLTVKKVEKILEDAHTTLTNPCPKASETCEFCRWRAKQEKLNKQCSLFDH